MASSHLCSRNTNRVRLIGSVRSSLHALCTLFSGVSAPLRLENALSRGRKFCQLLRRTDWANDKIAAAVRTTTTKLALGAISTKRALKGTDQGIRCTRRQILVAAFAIR